MPLFANSAGIGVCELGSILCVWNFVNLRKLGHGDLAYGASKTPFRNFFSKRSRAENLKVTFFCSPRMSTFKLALNWLLEELIASYYMQRCAYENIQAKHNFECIFVGNIIYQN
jgi:hypothetical protein